MNSATAQVPRAPLGSSELMVSMLGLGTVKFGRNTGVKYPAGFALPDDRTVRELLDVACELGINLLDTAPAYGCSEQRLGRLLTERHKWVLCSKTGEEFADGSSYFDFSAKHTVASVHRSLKRLNTDYLDLVLVHSDGNDRRIIEHTDCFETLMRLREQGLIRGFGLSGKTTDGSLLALERGADAIMVTYNRGATDERPAIQAAARLRRGVLIKKALDSGHAVAAGRGQPDPLQASMDFVFSEPGVSSVVVGTLNTDHLRQNAAAALRALRAGGS